MTELDFSQSQGDMRLGYYCGAPGVAVSGLAWLVAGAFAVWVSPDAAVLALLVGGALIHPLSVLVSRLLGRSGGHTKGNRLGVLAGEATVWFLAAIAIAYGLGMLRIEWFFPAMLLLIGGRYLTFQTLYGMRIYWLLGAVLLAAGLVLALSRAPVVISAFAGGVIEIAFAVLLFAQPRRYD